MELKICKNCKYYETKHYAGMYKCSRNTIKEIDLENGNTLTYNYIYTDREPEDPLPTRIFNAILYLNPKLLKKTKCGPEGKYYEAL